jgi:hypothetical protein
VSELLVELISILGGAASVSCLNLGNYMSHYHICSIQAVYVLHTYEHLVGSTNQWVTLRSVAVMIAKGLGLHKYATSIFLTSVIVDRISCEGL